MPAKDYYSSKTSRLREACDVSLHRERISFDYLRTVCPTHGSFVDLGCGTGWFMEMVQNAFPALKTIGLEYSRDQIANKVSLQLDIREADFCEPLLLDDDSVDIVYCGEIIEHLVNPDFFLRQIHRILKTNGIAIVTTPNLCAWHSRILMLFGIQPICYEASSEDARIGFGPLKALKKDALPVGHLRLFSLRALSELLRHYHFSIDTVRGTAFDYFESSVVRFVDRALTTIPGIASGIMIAVHKDPNN